MKNKVMAPLEQTPGGSGIGGALSTVAISVSQANGILAGILAALAGYRAIREAWKAAHPNVDAPFVSDAELIALLRQDAALGLAEVDALIAKYST